jgi:hypothetical protein
MSGSINNPDVANTSKVYWEKVLRSQNLDMGRGRRREDEYAERQYCEDKARELREAGQPLPDAEELVGYDVVLSETDELYEAPEASSEDEL